MENIKTGIHGGLDSTKVSTNTMVQECCIPSTAVSRMNVHQFEVNVFGAVAMIEAVLPSCAGASRYHRPMDLSPTFRSNCNV
jgi:hypothetical protein